jgi:very-short-patch-repair endonuclease
MKNPHLPYEKVERAALEKPGTKLAQSLRKRQTEAERALWSKLRNRQLDGWKFKRQFPFGPYVLDFYCFDANLVIEVDGSQHGEIRAEHDRARTKSLESRGLRVLRVWNADVLTNIAGVLESVFLVLGQKPAPPTGLKRQSQIETITSALRAPSCQAEKEVSQDDEQT